MCRQVSNLCGAGAVSIRDLSSQCDFAESPAAHRDDLCSDADVLLGGSEVKIIIIQGNWSRRPELNWRPSDYKSGALPAELHRLNFGSGSSTGSALCRRSLGDSRDGFVRHIASALIALRYAAYWIVPWPRAPRSWRKVKESNTEPYLGVPLAFKASYRPLRGTFRKLYVCDLRCGAECEPVAGRFCSAGKLQGFDQADAWAGSESCASASNIVTYGLLWHPSSYSKFSNSIRRKQSMP